MRFVTMSRVAIILGLCVMAAACATTESLTKPGFYTEVKDGRLWVFREGSKELAEFKKSGEPAQQVTRVGAGPKGMTIKGPDAKTIDDYLAAK
jgi:hypothetical protein